MDTDKELIAGGLESAVAGPKRGLVVQRFGEAKDGGLAVGRGGGEKGAAALSPEKTAEGPLAGEGSAFVVVPKLHGWDRFLFRERVGESGAS